MGTVFISHVQEDAHFARYLAAVLRVAGFDPWLAEERLPVGADLEDALARAIAEADCGVFLVAPRFSRSDHCMNELRLFAECNPPKWLIPILRRPRQELTIPAHLSRQVAMEWIDDVTNRDEAQTEVGSQLRSSLRPTVPKIEAMTSADDCRIALTRFKARPCRAPGS